LVITVEDPEQLGHGTVVTLVTKLVTVDGTRVCTGIELFCGGLGTTTTLLDDGMVTGWLVGGADIELAGIEMLSDGGGTTKPMLVDALEVGTGICVSVMVVGAVV